MFSLQFQPGVLLGVQQDVQQGVQQGVPQDVQQGVPQDVQQGVPQDVQQGVQQGVQPDQDILLEQLAAAIPPPFLLSNHDGGDNAFDNTPQLPQNFLDGGGNDIAAGLLAHDDPFPNLPDIDHLFPKPDDSGSDEI